MSGDGKSDRSLAVVLISGGMDSCVTAGLAAIRHDIAALHVNYGQRTQARELKAFHDIADFYNVPDNLRLVVSIEHLARIGGSSLVDTDMAISEAAPGSQGIPNTYVPFRNANMLSIAVSWAEVTGAESIHIGAVEEDSSGYPDCRKVFYDAYQKVIETGTRYEHPIRIVTPLIDMSKADIVMEGLRIGAPLHLTWSCYKNEDRACGRCESCALRLRGFQRAGVKDPVEYV
jgi:7-cyano-7-deazaguanine synthase